MRIESATQTLRSEFGSRGYVPIETPLIEQTELFLRMSGGLLSSQLFDFTSPDGSSISVRPEMTSPVIRYALENQISVWPQRYQYAAPIVRYSERPYDAPPKLVPSRRQFTQVGAELIGSSHPAADGEVVAMAYGGAKRFVKNSVSVRIGHVGLIWSILGRLGLSGRAQLFLANRVGELSNGKSEQSAIEAEAKTLGLLTDEPDSGDAGPEGEFLRRLVSGGVDLPYQSDQTSRSAAEIVDRLKKKLDEPHDASAFTDAFRLVSTLARISGEPDDVLKRIASATGEFGIGHLAELDNLGDVVAAALDEGVEGDSLTVNVGLATGFAYYTGMIFEVSSITDSSSERWGGGGRYDRLATALGSMEEIPALGFALNLDAMLPPIDSARAHADNDRLVLVAPKPGAGAQSVAEVAADFRERGFNAFTLFEATTEARATADALGASKIVYVGDARQTESVDL